MAFLKKQQLVSASLFTLVLCLVACENEELRAKRDDVRAEFLALERARKVLSESVRAIPKAPKVPYAITERELEKAVELQKSLQKELNQIEQKSIQLKELTSSYKSQRGIN